MTLTKSARVVPRVSMLFDLIPGPCHDICDAIDETFILPLHIISFEVGYFLVIFRVGERRGLSSRLDHRFDPSKVSIVPSLILKVHELLCFLDVH